VLLQYILSTVGQACKLSPPFGFQGLKPVEDCDLVPSLVPVSIALTTMAERRCMHRACAWWVCAHPQGAKGPKPHINDLSQLFPFGFFQSFIYLQNSIAYIINHHPCALCFVCLLPNRLRLYFYRVSRIHLHTPRYLAQLPLSLL
jgi:hypothetical protein